MPGEATTTYEFTKQELQDMRNGLEETLQRLSKEIEKLNHEHTRIRNLARILTENIGE